MANYKELIPFILRWEGGFSNRKSDRGGATNKGITLATYRSVFGQNKSVDDLKKLTDAEWMTIFKKLFWDKCKADSIQDQSIANLLVDWAWNSGATTPIKKLQGILGVTADGIIGKQTLNAVNTKSPLPIFGALKQARISFYNAIVKSNPSQKVFLKGWLNRVNHIVYGELL